MNLLPFLWLFSTFWKDAYTFTNFNDSSVDSWAHSIHFESTSNQLLKKSIFLSPDAYVFHRSLDSNVKLKVTQNDSDFYQITRNASSACVSDLVYIISKLSSLSKNIWLMQMIDSFGKLESGVLEGNLHWDGNYWQCLAIDVPSRKILNSTYNGFKGRYCSITWSLANITQLVTGICVPDSCNSQDIKQESKKIEHIFSSLSIFAKLINKISLISSKCLKPVELDTNAIVCICFLTCFTALIIVSTIIDAWFQNDKQIDEQNNNQEPKIFVDKKSAEELEINVNSDTLPIVMENSSLFNSTSSFNHFIELLICFSLYSNLPKLFHGASKKKNSEKEIKCIHGIRTLSMFWIIICHTYGFGFLLIKNPLYFLKQIDNFPFVTILNGFFSVDTFFLMSGFLLAYLFFSQTSKKRKPLDWFIFYFHRYWRLIPVYAIIIWVYVTLVNKLASGPYWDDGEQEISSSYKNCKKYWWRNILFINNLYLFQDMCLFHTWYLPNDFQFFLLSSFFLILLSWKAKIGFFVTITTCIISCLATFIVSYTKNLAILYTEMNNIGLESNIKNQSKNVENMENFLNIIYIKPYYRISPYLIGLLTGYLVCWYESWENKHLNKLFKNLASITAIILCLTSLYSIYHSHLSQMEASLYVSLSRPSWALGVVWLIFACVTRNAVLINHILSAKIFLPFSKLTYCAYLLHPIIQTVYFQSFKAGIYFSHFSWMTIALISIFYTYLCSIVFFLFFELPFINIEKKLLKTIKNE